MPDFEETYSLMGTYAGRTGQGVAGALEVTDQNGSTATASITLELLDNGNTFFVLNTPSDVVAATVAPGEAHLANNESFSLVFSGREEIFGWPAEYPFHRWGFSESVEEAPAEAVAVLRDRLEEEDSLAREHAAWRWRPSDWIPSSRDVRIGECSRRERSPSDFRRHGRAERG